VLHFVDRDLTGKTALGGKASKTRSTSWSLVSAGARNSHPSSSLKTLAVLVLTAA
jgi:hypothetical protein